MRTHVHVSLDIVGILAVSRSLGDAVLKQVVTCAPYTCKTHVLVSDTYAIIACDGLWDVCTDQEAVDHIADTYTDPTAASARLVQYALQQGSTDNLTVMVIVFIND